MNSPQYSHEIEQFMIKAHEHSEDFKSLVLRLMALYNDNVKLVSAITKVPESVILQWKTAWNEVNPSSTQAKYNLFNDDHI